MTTSADQLEPMPGQEIQLRVGGYELAGRQFGPSDGYPVLALHGWMDHSDSFAPIAPLLEGCRTVALDLPGHGLTPMGEQGNWFHYIDNVALVFEALNVLGWDRCHLMGHSMGGGLASLAAAAFPERFRSMVSIDMLGPISGPTEKVAEQLRKGILDRSKGLQQRYFSTMEETLAARENASFPLALCKILAARGIEQTDKGFTWRGDRRLKWSSLQRLSESHVRHLLEAIECPTLVLLAEQLRYPQMKAALEKRQGLIPNERIITAPGGHHLHMENPEVCAGHINEFFDSLPS